MLNIEKSPTPNLPSVVPLTVELIRGQKLGPDRILRPNDLIPVTRISLRQFSPVSWVHRWPPTHQSHGNKLETHSVQEVNEAQS